MNTQKLERTQYNLLPDDPGVYRFFDEEGIIYVGKAKNLKKRVSSYFTKNDHNRKTYRLVQEIHYIQVTVVNSEFDALLLENSLIKENQPKYNILLKDDKSFPSICITNERFPRIYSTRRIDRSKGQYFGPYTSVKAMNNVLDLIRKLYKIRTCNFNLSETNIAKGKFKVCLEYHIGNCLGPCEGLQQEHEYMVEIAQAKEILKGNISPIRKSFLGQMQEAATELNFELAQSFKVKLEYLEKFQVKSLIVQQKFTNLDVFTILHDEPKSYINYMMIEEGTIKISETVEVKNNLNNSPEDILQYSMLALRDKYQSSNKEVLTNIELEDWPEVSMIVPKIGDKKKLIDLSLKNAFMSKREKQAQAENIKNKPNHALIELKKELQLTEMPYHIECFDNSNIQGTHPVASMVCFKNGKPSKKDYRKFNIKTVVGPDDFSSMYEIVTRRYSKLLNEGLPFPKLVVIDGGKGQLGAAVKALKDLGVYGEIPICGIAKRLEEIYVPNDPIPLHISKKSEALKLLQHARDEAHRFAITFHRQKRSKTSLKSELDEIKGIGQNTRELLFREFGSVEKMKKADFEQLSAAVGPSKAQLLKSAFKK
ncbi:MAG: excinuclease ABC subunit UvrC [Cytophagales bacterium]|nr:excinuclease ABC subunit UvrC [Cytophagales bacterium]